MDSLTIQVVAQEAYVSDFYQTIMWKVSIDTHVGEFNCQEVHGWWVVVEGSEILCAVTMNLICGLAHYNHFYVSLYLQLHSVWVGSISDSQR